MIMRVQMKSSLYPKKNINQKLQRKNISELKLVRGDDSFYQGKLKKKDFNLHKNKLN